MTRNRGFDGAVALRAFVATLIGIAVAHPADAYYLTVESVADCGVGQDGIDSFYEENGVTAWSSLEIGSCIDYFGQPFSMMAAAAADVGAGAFSASAAGSGVGGQADARAGFQDLLTVTTPFMLGQYWEVHVVVEYANSGDPSLLPRAWVQSNGIVLWAENGELIVLQGTIVEDDGSRLHLMRSAPIPGNNTLPPSLVVTAHARNVSSASFTVTDFWIAVPSGVTVTSESGQVPIRTIPACDDGLDNDGDGLVDYAASGGDPACQTPTSPLENPKCDDDLDNDSDGGTDWDGGVAAGSIDAQCAGKPWRNKEVACGLGAELALVMPLVAALRRRWLAEAARS